MLEHICIGLFSTKAFTKIDLFQIGGMMWNLQLVLQQHLRLEHLYLK